MFLKLNLRFFWMHPFLAGVAGGAFLLFVFFSLMLSRTSWGVAASEFLRLWPWIIALIAGFSTQVYLYAFLKKSVLRSVALNAAKGEVAVAGGISTAAMAACCAHHFTDILPFVGLTVAASFLFQYQELFLLTGVLSNALGIIMMLGVFKKMKITSKNPVIKSFSAKQFDFALKAGAIASVALVLAYALVFIA